MCRKSLTTASLRHLCRVLTTCHIKTYGSVWESNPLTALFKPPTGFEDQGPHQRCKHSQPSGTFSVGAEQKCVKRGADAATGVRRGRPTPECWPLRPARGRSVTRARLRVLGDCRASRVRPRT